MTDPILIVGAGPTGLTAALELSRLGLPVRLIDKAKQPATTSRAVGVQARTLELLEQRGLAAEMVRLGNPGRAASVYGDGKRVVRLDFSRVDSRYDYVLFISQAETERILREAIGRHGVAVEREVELVGLSQDASSHDPSPVKAVLRHADGRLEQAQAPWLVSAEGAHSVVRTTLDLAFEGKTLDQEYVLGDLHIDGDLPQTDLHIFSSIHGFMGLFPMGDGRFRLIASNPLSTPKQAAEPSLEALQGIYDQRSHIAARFHDMTWSSWFRINSRMVSRLKIGRLLLGGDAAHIHSPAAAQGMNTGIQDNHLGPIIGGAELTQNSGTARMSQVALGYRDSSLSSNHSHAGGLHAGDRVPDLPVRHRTTTSWVAANLLGLLDPSRFTLLVARGDEATVLDPELLDAASGHAELVSLVELAPVVEAPARSRYEAAFGRRLGVFLVRPDGYVGLAAGEHSAARELATYLERWCAPREQVHVN